MTQSDPRSEQHQLDVALGRSIRERRKALGLSQSALAAAVSLTFQQIQKYERGFNRVSFSRLVMIAHALGCRVIDLIGDLDAPEQTGGAASLPHASPLDSDGAELRGAFAKLPVDLRRAILRLVIELGKEETSPSQRRKAHAEGVVAAPH